MKKNWNLKLIYETREDLESDIVNLKATILQLNGLKTKLAENIGLGYELLEEIYQKLDNIFMYAMLMYNADMADQESLQHFQDINNLANETSANLAWFIPEMLLTSQEDILKNLTEKQLQDYRHSIDTVYAQKAHTLDAKNEEILSQMNATIQSIVNTYNLLTNADQKSVKATLKNGQEVEISNANYAKLLTELNDQEDRRLVFETYFAFYEEHQNTLASLYYSRISANAKVAKLRGYESSLHAKLADLQIPLDVYKTLIKVARENTHILHKYQNYKKEHLNLKEIHTYDRMQKVHFSDEVFSVEKAYEIVDAASKKASDKYNYYLNLVLADGRVDLLPNENKLSGAYSASSYSAGPFILHNYDETLNGVYTLMHEAGHSIHTQLAIEEQTFFNSKYPIYLAEIASTFAERILDDYMLENSKNDQTKATLLEDSIISTIATFYRQTLFADFEYQTHALVDKNESLTSEKLSNIMKELYKTYYDIDLNNENSKRLVWAYVPHLINFPFYVYQYATCFAASLKIYQDYSLSKEQGLEKLEKILKAGGSNYPNEILLSADIDLTKEDTYLAVVQFLEQTFEKLIALK